MSRRRHLQIVVSDGKDRHDTCYQRTRHLPSIEDLRLDVSELLLLKLFRYTCASLANETAHGWETAHQVAAQELGEPDGPALVDDIVALLHAIRAERHGEFSFMPADCPICSRRLSEEERTTLELLRAARQGDDMALADRASKLAAGGPTEGIAFAAEVLGAHLVIHAHSVHPQPSLSTGRQQAD